MDPYLLTVVERRTLLSELQQFEPSAWDAPSLCQGWRVRDVVAHLNIGCLWKFGPMLKGMAQARFDLDTFLDVAARRGGELPVTRLLSDFESIVESKRRPPAVPPADVLVETIVHRLDILRPLGLPAAIDRDHLQFVLDRKVGPESKPKHVSLMATDMQWRAGDGPEVNGPAASILLALFGRKSALAEVEGPGVELLRQTI